MSRPQHLSVPNTPEGIRRINELQREYDRDPEGYERREQEQAERRAHEGAEMRDMHQAQLQEAREAEEAMSKTYYCTACGALEAVDCCCPDYDDYDPDLPF